MAKFKDTKGREWHINLTVAGIERVLEKHQINILKITEIDGGLPELYGNMLLFCKALWLLIDSEPDTPKISYEDFSGGLKGDVIDAARTALEETLVDFCHSPERRDTIRETLDLATKVEKVILQRGVTGLKSIDPELVATTLLNSATNSPVS